MFNSMIAAAANSGQPDEAVSWLEEMRLFNIQPTQRTYATVMNAWFKKDSPAEVMNTLQQMQREGFKPTVVDYIMAMSALARVPAVEQIEDLLRQMISEKTYPNARTCDTLRISLGAERFAQLSKELCLHRRFDPNADLAEKYIADGSLKGFTVKKVVAKSSTRR